MVETGGLENRLALTGLGSQDVEKQETPNEHVPTDAVVYARLASGWLWGGHLAVPRQTLSCSISLGKMTLDALTLTKFDGYSREAFGNGAENPCNHCFSLLGEKCSERPVRCRLVRRHSASSFWLVSLGPPGTTSELSSTGRARMIAIDLSH